MTEPLSPTEMLALLIKAGQQAGMAAIEAELASHTYVGGKRVRIQPLPKLAADAARTVHRVKVTLYGSKPPVWRRLDIPSAMPLDQLHEVLQVAFEWYDMHLHSFETTSGRFGPADRDDWGEPDIDETTATLGQVAGAEKAKVVYIYDFGDDWRHDIVVEKVLPATPGVAYPRCITGRGQAPAEDSGGIWAAIEADGGEPLDPDEVTGALAALATVLIT
jgi:Plasmid pRiA4b ORF-3-like protein